MRCIKFYLLVLLINLYFPADVNDELVLVHNNNHFSSNVSSILTCLPNALDALERPSVKIQLHTPYWDFHSIGKRTGNTISHVATQNIHAVYYCSGYYATLDIIGILGKADGQKRFKLNCNKREYIYYGSIDIIYYNMYSFLL